LGREKNADGLGKKDYAPLFALLTDNKSIDPTRYFVRFWGEEKKPGLHFAREIILINNSLKNCLFSVLREKSGVMA